MVYLNNLQEEDIMSPCNPIVTPAIQSLCQHCICYCDHSFSSSSSTSQPCYVNVFFICFIVHK